MRLHTSQVVAATSIALITASALGAPALAGRGNPHHTPPPTPSPQPWTTLATGLDNPRLLSFDGNVLYVAESGRGGTGACVPNPEGGGEESCLGATGAVTKVWSKRTKVHSHRGHHKSRRVAWRTTVHQTRVVTGLPSLAGADGSAATGPADVLVDGKRWTATIGLAGTPTTRTDLGAGAELLGTVATGTFAKKSGHGSGKSRGSRRTGPTVLADLAAFEAAQNPDGAQVDSNPTGLAADRKGFVATDAGGNSVLRIGDKGRHGRQHRAQGSGGSVSTLAFFGAVDGMDAVPTSAAKGPDGAWYVSQLTGFPFPVNGASIFRVVPGKAPTVYATGLTNVTDLAWHRGKLYVVQLADKGLLAPENETALPQGSLRVIKKDKTSQVVVDKLPAPYGVALRGSSAYVTTCAICAGGGSVVKIPLK